MYLYIRKKKNNVLNGIKYNNNGKEYIYIFIYVSSGVVVL